MQTSWNMSGTQRNVQGTLEELVNNKTYVSFMHIYTYIHIHLYVFTFTCIDRV